MDEHVDRPGVEGEGFIQKLPEEQNHLGTTFESPQLSAQLYAIRESDREINYFDLTSLIRAEKEDIAFQKISFGQTNPKEKTDTLFQPSETSLEEVSSIMEAIQTGELEELEGRDRNKKGEKLLEYLDNRIKWAEKREEAQDNTTETDPREPRTDSAIFKKIREEIVTQYPGIELSLEIHESKKVHTLLEDIRKDHSYEGKEPTEAQLEKERIDDLAVLLYRMPQILGDHETFIRLYGSVSKIDKPQEINPADRDDILSFLKAIRKHLIKEAKSPHTKADSRGRVEANAVHITQMLEAFEKRTTLGIGEKPTMKAEDSKEFMKGLLPSPEEFTQYDIPLSETVTALEAITDEPTHDQVLAFYEGLLADVVTQEQLYEENPKWKAKKEIVQSAIEFYRAHQEEETKGARLIHVTAATDGSIRNVGWHTTAENESDTADYVLDPDGIFSPGTADNDPKGLHYHAYNLQDFELLNKALLEAKEALAKMQKGKKITLQQRHSLTQMAVRFAGDKQKAVMTVVKGAKVKPFKRE